MERVLLATVALVVYFTPSIIGRLRRIEGFPALVLFNVLTGWSALGWLTTLVWAAAVPRRRAATAPPPACP